MIINKIANTGLVELIPQTFFDKRGSFQETFNKRVFEEAKIPTKFVQDNESNSIANVFRGLHFQKEPYSQGKLVRVPSGSVIDIVVDLREASSTFKQVFSLILDDVKKNIFYIPPGFAHGFLSLEKCIFSYKCTEPYNKEAESGVNWKDPSLNITKFLLDGTSPYSNPWSYIIPSKLNINEILTSEKDEKLPFLKEALEMLPPTLKITSTLKFLSNTFGMFEMEEAAEEIVGQAIKEKDWNISISYDEIDEKTGFLQLALNGWFEPYYGSKKKYSLSKEFVTRVSPKYGDLVSNLKPLHNWYHS